MKFSSTTLLAVFALATPILSAGGKRDSNNGDALPASTPASSVLATLTSLPTTLKDAQYTSLASALYSVQKGFYNDKSYTTVASHMWSAAAKASDSEKVVPSLAMSTLVWDQVTAAPWYDKNMPKEDKKFVSQYLGAWADQYNKFVSGGGKDAKSGGDDKKGSSAAQNAVVVWSVAGLAGLLGFVAVL